MTRKGIALLAAIFLVAAAAARAASAQIYNDHANASQLIRAAVRKATASHENIVLDFGANWCPDCHALDVQMRQGELAKIITRHFVIVHISVGRYDRNLGLARQYQIPLRKGIPALAVLDPRGKLLYSQKNGEFENARAMGTTSFLAFFKRWEPRLR